MTVGGWLRTALIAVNEAVLDALVQAATTDASADDVTPPLTPSPAWTPARVAWLRSFHRDRRAGMNGPAREATWALVVEERVVGSVRLKRTNEHGVLETGIWVTRGARGRGVGQRAMAEVLKQAVALGAVGVRAETTAGNIGALKILQRLGFDIAPVDDHDCVPARISLGPQVATPEDHYRTQAGTPPSRRPVDHA